MNRRHFVVQEGSSNKFWEIRTEGAKLVTRHGRVGSAGRETAKAFASPKAAEAAAEASIRAKVKKGYREAAARKGATSKPSAASRGTAVHPSALVERLAAALERHRPGFIAALPRAATEKSIASLETKLGLPLPESLKAVLTWHDGTGDESLIEDLSLSSVRDIAANKKSFDDLNPKSEAPGQWWNDKWIPILDNHSYDAWVIDWAGSFGGKPGQILAWQKDGRSRTILFDSFDHLLLSFVLALEAGHYAESDNGFVAGERAFGKIRDSLCRGYPKKVDYRITAKGELAGKFAEVGKLAPPAKATVTDIVAHPDGTQIVIAQTRTPLLSMLDVKTRKVARLENAGEGVIGLAVSADQRELVYLLHTKPGWSSDFELRRRSLDGGAPRTLARFPEQCQFTSLSVAPGLATFNTPKGIEIRALPSGKRLRFLPTKKDAIAAFSPDGRWLVSSVQGSKKIELRSWPAFKLVWTAKGDFTHATRFAFDPSGERIAALVVGNGRPHPALFDRATGAKRLPAGFRKGAESPQRLEFSPDGKWLVIGDSSGRLVVYDAKTGELAWAKQIHDDSVLAIALSRDGRKVYAGSLHKSPVVIVSTPG